MQTVENEEFWDKSTKCSDGSEEVSGSPRKETTFAQALDGRQTKRGQRRAWVGKRNGIPERKKCLRRAQ